MRAYKFLTAAGHGPYSEYAWSLPVNGNPGDWIEVDGKLIACLNGIHGCRRDDVLRWCDARLFVLEYDGETFVHEDEKLVGRRARLTREITTWNQTTARLLAADFAEHVAHLWKPLPGNDWSPAATISVCRRYAAGVATDDERAAAGAAAGAAARAAARAGARAGARAAARAAARAGVRASAWDAVRDAARDAAWDAARDAARAAASRWQLDRFWQYVGGDIDVDAACARIRGEAS